MVGGASFGKPCGEGDTGVADGPGIVIAQHVADQTLTFIDNYVGKID